MKSKNESRFLPLQQSKASAPASKWFWYHLLKKSFYLIALLLSFAAIACNKDTAGSQTKQPGVPAFKEFDNKVILDWNLITLEVMDGPQYQHTLLAARMNAMVHIAMHDALNSIAPVFERYAYKAAVDTGAHPVVAAAAAAYTVLVDAFPEKKTILDNKLSGYLQNIPEGLRKHKGMEIGVLSGLAINTQRKNDGAFANPIGQIPVSNTPGVYQAVPPFDFIFAPTWTTMQPFGLSSPQQFRSKPHPALNSERYAKDFNEVKQTGFAGSKTRSAEQTFYAKFWYEFSEIGWNRIGRIAATDHKLDLLSTARLFALLNMALVDSYIAGWDSKFHYNLWRPYTAIRFTGEDGNTATIADTSWQPLLPTPPVQDYPSTHSVLGNAGATVLTYYFGNKASFTMTSTTSDPVNASRKFQNFYQAADENADSRVRAGIHFRFATEAGQEMGNKIGKWIDDHWLQLKK